MVASLLTVSPRALVTKNPRWAPWPGGFLAPWDAASHAIPAVRARAELSHPSPSRSSGELPLDAVHDECIAASLAATRGTAQEKLWDVLSCAIDAVSICSTPGALAGRKQRARSRAGARNAVGTTQGLGAYAIDFIREVTLDEHMSSADREEHELMDEGAALGWASQAARQALGALSGHLRAGGPDLESAGAFSSKLDVLSVAVGLLRWEMAPEAAFEVPDLAGADGGCESSRFLAAPGTPWTRGSRTQADTRAPPRAATSSGRWSWRACAGACGARGSA